MLLRLRMLLNRATTAVLAELVGTAVLVGTVVGSGISATRLTDDVGLQLLLNALATVAVLGVLIASLAPVSGAHLNPVVTLALCVRRSTTPSTAAFYVAAQSVGAVAGTLLAHAMFELPLGAHATGRSGAGQWLGELVATTGLVLVVLAARAPAALLVPAWIGGAYVFTSSTSFANPAVTLGRAFTDSFSGIAWSDVPGFVLAQLAGGGLALLALHLTQERP